MSTAQQTTTETIKSLLDIVKTLKGFIDLQSSRIDRLEKHEDKVNLILSRYQMTKGSDLTNSPLKDLKKIVEGADEHRNNS
tara:strand:- start:262 stop:504 length:243 start_codon:yes stop_codon:yes gene_type:complete